MCYTPEGIVSKFMVLYLDSGQVADLIFFFFLLEKIIHPVVKWIKIFYGFLISMIPMVPKVFIVPTMAGNHNFRNRDEIVVGERKKLELQVLSG